MVFIDKEKFLKILIYEESNHPNYFNIIDNLHKNNYEIYTSNKLLDIKEYLKIIPFDLIIVEYDLFMKNKKILTDNLYIEMIVLLNKKDSEILSPIYKEENIIDYYFFPLDIDLLVKKINFYLKPKKNNVKYRKNLYDYLWEVKLLQEYKLHKLIINNNKDFYNMGKISQYILYFSYILNLINHFFLFNKEYSCEKLYLNVIHLITLQLCFFNVYIKFTGDKKNFPIEINNHILYFFLFLFFIGELLKGINLNIEIFINFYKDNDNYYVSIEFDSNLKEFLETYNQMNIERELLNDFIKEYLWENWKRKINFNIKNGKMIILEFLLLTKKNII
jgi:hypothetical protein